MSSFATRPTLPLPSPTLPSPTLTPQVDHTPNTPTTFIILLVCLVPIKEVPLKASIHDLTKCGCLSKN